MPDDIRKWMSKSGVYLYFESTKGNLKLHTLLRIQKLLEYDGGQ